MKMKLAILCVVGLNLLVSSGWAPAAVAAEPEKADQGDQIKFNDTPLYDLIKLLARDAEINITFDPKLLTPTVKPDGTIGAAAQPIVPGFRWTGVTAQQALDAILLNYSLQMVLDPKTKIARVSTKDPQLEPIFTDVIQLKYASPTNIAPLLQSSVSAKTKITPDVRTSQLAIAATEKDWVVISNLVERLDTATRQVLIEGHILSTIKNPQSIKGIDWSGTLANQNFGFGNGVLGGTINSTQPGIGAASQTLPGGRVINTTSVIPGTQSSTLTSTVGGLIPGISANTLQGFNPNVAFLTADGVRGALHFLNTDADTDVIATPRTVTMDNEMARLEVTTGHPIFNTSPGSANTPATTTVTYTNVGVILTVTPRITANNYVSLKITPEVSDTDGTDTQTISGQVNVANVFTFSKIDTRVMVPSGNTLVMGGLIKNSTLNSYTKIPFLGDMPGLGKYLFAHESKNTTKQNLIIFITPTIVNDTDFQTSTGDFLKTKLLEKPDFGETPWDSGKPKDWKKTDY